jgi:hypothetical protein
LSRLRCLQAPMCLRSSGAGERVAQRTRELHDPVVGLERLQPQRLARLARSAGGHQRPGAAGYGGAGA